MAQYFDLIAFMIAAGVVKGEVMSIYMDMQMSGGIFVRKLELTIVNIFWDSHGVTVGGGEGGSVSAQPERRIATCTVTFSNQVVAFRGSRFSRVGERMYRQISSSSG